MSETDTTVDLTSLAVHYEAIARDCDQNAEEATRFVALMRNRADTARCRAKAMRAYIARGTHRTKQET